MSNIKNNRIALDIGNVLCYVDFNNFYRELAIQGVCGSVNDAEKFLINYQSMLDLGIVNMEQCLKLRWPNLNNEQVAHLIDAWMSVVVPCNEVIEAVDELINNGAIVAILSNIGTDHANYLSNKLKNTFNKCIKHFSCDVGARKPTKLFYQSFILDNESFAKLKFDKNNGYRGIFLDDREDNIISARPYLDGHIFNLYHYKNANEAASSFLKFF